MEKGYRNRLKRMYSGMDDREMEKERRDMLEMSALMKQTAAEDAASGVKPFLADRVMRRIAADRRSPAPAEELWAGLVWIFRPVAAVCMLLALVLSIHNIYLSRQYATTVSPVEAVLAIPDVNTVTAYELDLTSFEEEIEP